MDKNTLLWSDVEGDAIDFIITKDGVLKGIDEYNELWELPAP